MLSSDLSPLISVVIPVFNNEKTIEKCVNSILNQDFENFEIVIVNDGSTDSSSNACLNLCEKDKRIKYLEKENGGVSSARNLALEKICGKYVYFCDADDYLDNGCFSYMLSLINKECEPKMCAVAYFVNNKKIDIGVSNEISCINQLDSAKAIALINLRFGAFLWNKLFSADIIKENNIRFDESIHVREDALFCYEYIKHISCAAAGEKAFYHYIISENTATSQAINERRLTALDACKKIIDMCECFESTELNSRLECEYTINCLRILTRILRNPNQAGLSCADRVFKDFKRGFFKLITNKYTSARDIAVAVFIRIAFPLWLRSRSKK